MPNFEYHILEVPMKGMWNPKVDYEVLNKKLNELGRKGWEIVSTTNATIQHSTSYNLVIILKRELSH